jgi:hypothetical protein
VFTGARLLFFTVVQKRVVMHIAGSLYALAQCKLRCHLWVHIDHREICVVQRTQMKTVVQKHVVMHIAGSLYALAQCRLRYVFGVY